MKGIDKQTKKICFKFIKIVELKFNRIWIPFNQWVPPPTTLMPTLDEGPRSNFLGTNLDSFEANWILELDCTLVPILIRGSPNYELSI